MKPYYYVLIGILVSTLTFLACERDDICAETTATTSKLIIRFYDNDGADDETPKDVRQLQVRGLDEDGNVLDSLELIENVFQANIDSISIPLRFDVEGVLETTQFQFIRNADLDDDNPDGPPDPDVVTIRYTPEFQYVSRACGYRSIFELQAGNGFTHETTDNWIIRTEVVNPIIDNETSLHISIYH